MSDVTPRTFLVKDTVRNINTGTERIVRKVNGSVHGGDVLLVRQNESDERSVLWTWDASNCDLVISAPTFNVHDFVTLGSGTVKREILDTRIHFKTNEMQYRVDLDDEKNEKWVTAAALHPYIEAAATFADLDHVESVAYDLKDTDAAWDDTLEDTGEAIDLRPQMLRPEECPKCGRMLPMIEHGDHEGEGIVYGDCWFCSGKELVEADPRDADALMRAAQALADEQEKTLAAEERAKVAELQVKKLETKLREMEACVRQSQPIAATQLTCVEYKTVVQQLYPEQMIDVADKQMASMENQGWTLFKLESLMTTEETSRVVTFKRTVETPVQPTRGNASAAAGLTSPFVSQGMYRARQQQAVEPDAILEPVNRREIKLGPIGTSIKERGVEATSQMMTSFAVQQAFDKAQARIDATPAFNQSLHTLKANN